ncbi:MAG TPA: DUF4236 domain-containing protein [Clostridia bacterium]|nr:DUF4236 domain-containing protein [Clostridia bacterium]
MGFYIRKSISFGGLRVNFSKSGVGFSAGVKGFRIGTGPRGNYIHMGANGFYYRQTLGGGPNSRVAEPKSAPEDRRIYDYKDIETKDVLQLVDSSADGLLTEISKKNQKVKLTVIWAWLAAGLTMINIILVFSFLLLPLLSYVDKRRKTTVLAYDIDEEKERDLQRFYDSFNEIIGAKRKWHVSSRADLYNLYDRKVNAGAGNLVERSEIAIDYGIPPYFKTNIKIPKFKAGRKVLYFFPDRMLIFDKKKVGSVNYKDLIIESSNTTFIENASVPSDTTVVGHTWQYVNKSGGPDRRFANNRQLPIVKYTQLRFRSDTGLDEMIQVSRPDIGSDLVASLDHAKAALKT